jgi:SCP-2 sterol transfer family
VPEFLSEQWLRELDAAVRASAAVCALGPIVIEQVVASVPRRGEVRYQLVVDAGGARLAVGADTRPADMSLSTDYRTAVAIAAGKENAQLALADGRLRLGGNIDALVRRSDAFGALDDATAALREVTAFPSP